MAPPWWTMNTSGLTYFLTITGVNSNADLPEILSVTPAHGTLVTDSSTRVKFTMKGNVRPTTGKTQNGYIKIIRATLSSAGVYTPSK